MEQTSYTKNKKTKNNQIIERENTCLKIRWNLSYVLKFEPAKEAFYQLIFKKIESQVRYLKSQLSNIQSQLTHQERIFSRIEIRRQGRELLTCEYKKSIGCLGVYQCDNCQANYSVADNRQATEISQ